jgi:light-harvesting complex 1 beta chain
MSRVFGVLDSFAKKVEQHLSWWNLGKEPIAIGGKFMSSLTVDEAREFHAAFIRGKLGFYAIAIFAHACVWVWRPWF